MVFRNQDHCASTPSLCCSSSLWSQLKYVWPHVLPDQYSHAIFLSITYSAKFSLVFNFTYFAKFQPFVKLFQQKFVTRTLQLSRARVSMDNILGLCCCIRKGSSPIRYLQSRHWFADRCELEHGRRCRMCLYAMPILHYVVACTWFRQRICCKITGISTKSSKTAISENLDGR